MENFESLMKQAVNIKTGQMLQKRVKFEASPLFIKAGLYYLQKYENVRSQGFGQQYIVADLMKTRGNTFFKDEHYEKAAREYEQALSIFRFIRNKNANWKNEGIIDDDLEFINYDGADDDEKNLLKTMKVSLYNNLAACYLKIDDYKNAKFACDSVLDIDPNQAKALYRRAKAQTSDINASIEDYKVAIEDLKKAYMICPEDMNIQQALAKAKLEMNKMKMSGETFKKMFTKPIYNDVKNPDPTAEKLKSESAPENNTETSNSSSSLAKPVEAETPKGDSTRAPSTESTTRSNDKKLESSGEKVKDGNQHKIISQNNQEKQKIKNHPNSNDTIFKDKKIQDKAIENLIEGKDEQLFNFFEKTGRKQEAAELKEKMKEAIYARQQLEKLSKIDFDNPNSELADSAVKFGLDLKDPLIREELAKLKKQNLKKLKTSMKTVFNDGSESSDDEDKKSNGKSATQNTSNISTSIQNNTTNNYYINNNYYSNEPSKTSKGMENTQNAKSKAKIDPNTINDMIQNPDKYNHSNGKTQPNRMNQFIFCVAVGLFLITLYLQSNNNPTLNQ